MPSLWRKRADDEVLGAAVASVWAQGVGVDEAVADDVVFRTTVPGVPFLRQRYWLEGVEIPGAAAPSPIWTPPLS